MAGVNKEFAKQLQGVLNEVLALNPPLEASGKVDANTRAAIKQFQKKFKLKPTGFFNNDTLEKIIDAFDKFSTSAFEKTMKEIDEGSKKPKDEVRISFVIKGKNVALTREEYKNARKTIGRALLRGPLGQLSAALAEAEGLRMHIVALKKENPWITYLTSYGVDAPGAQGLKGMRAAVTTIENACKKGDFEMFVKIYPKLEQNIRNLMKSLQRYEAKLYANAGKWVVGLTFVKTSSFLFVSIMAAPAAASMLGTGALASSVVGGAAVNIVESAATEVGNFSAGVQDWKVSTAARNVVIDGGVGAVLGLVSKGKDGKHVLDAASEAVFKTGVKQEGFKLLSKATIKKASVYLVTEGAKDSLSGAVKDVGTMAKSGKVMSIRDFLTNIGENFAKGVALAPLAKVVDGFAKKGAEKLSKKDKDRFMVLALKEVSKQTKDKNLSISNVSKRATALAEKTIGDLVKKSIEPATDAAFNQMKGAASPTKLNTTMQSVLVGPKFQAQFVKELARVLTQEHKRAGSL